jgi:NTE family protein
VSDHHRPQRDARGQRTADRPLQNPVAPVRRGLVLGAGGVLGFAWMVGALQALQDEEGFDPLDAEVVVGTSSGSILAALLACGVGVDALRRHQQGIPLPADPAIDWNYDADSGGALPPWPGVGVGSRDLLCRVARNPRRLPPLAVLSALAPPGRGTLDPVGRMITAVAAIGGLTERWPSRPQTWIVAMDYSAGDRVAFGRDGAPPAALPDAVMASCSIPGWYAPVALDGHRYVDGGACSPASLDLLAGHGLDEVWVLAPTVSFAYDRPRSPVARLERRVRRSFSRRLLIEAAAVRETGTAVTVLAPGPEDLQSIGGNMMNPRRRTAVLETSLRTSASALRRRVDAAPGTPRHVASAGTTAS